MAKILVADDNSNVQKTVSLALADLCVEVASVNNGEAAVRKLADFSPDLVLADIFMPVRNGYEVCEYVKKDSRFAHVPVVLLVGAFDPLDEREAQRVGADGILKKPFVPPEPLITMVKTLLDRVLGERLVSVSAAKPSVTVPVRTTAPEIAKEHEHFPVSQQSHEPTTVREFAPPASRVTFEEGERPVAFGQLLEVPSQDAIQPATVIDPVDNDQVLTSSRDANLGDPIFWRNESATPETPAEAPEEIAPGLSMRTWIPEEESLPHREEGLLLQPIEPLELVREESEPTSETVIESEVIEVDPAAQAPLKVDSAKAPELAANPLEWMATAPPQISRAQAEVSPAWDDLVPEAPETSDAVAGNTPEQTQDVAPVPPAVLEPAAVPVEPSVWAQMEAAAAVETPDTIKTQTSIVRLERPPHDSLGAALSTPSQTKSADSGSEPTKTQPSLQPLQQVPEHSEPSAVSPAPETKPEESAPVANEAKPSDHSAIPEGSADSVVSAPLETIPVEPASGPSNIQPSPQPVQQVPEDLPGSKGSPEPEPKPVDSAPVPNKVQLSLRPLEQRLQALARSMVSAPPANKRGDQTTTPSNTQPTLQSPKPRGEDTVHSIPKHDWADLSAALQANPDVPSPQQAKLQPEPAAQASAGASENLQPVAASSPPPDTALVEAVVQRVLDKMRPQVVDIITKEFLRPIVQALVRREIDKY